MRALYVEAREGIVSSATLLGALVDLGAAPSPILRAVASLELPIDMRLDGGRVGFVPAHHGVLLQARQAAGLFDESGIEERAQKLAADALGRMLLAEEGMRGAFDANVDGAIVMAIAGAAVALAQLAPDAVVVGPIKHASADGNALLDCFEEGPEPAWLRAPARGACDGVAVALGTVGT